jgi:hypothetical protein
LLEVLKGGAVSLESPEITLELLRANAVVGVTGFFDKKRLRSIGIQCAFCHSTVDDSSARGTAQNWFVSSAIKVQDIPHDCLPTAANLNMLNRNTLMSAQS